MTKFKIDDTFFNDEIDYKDLDESIYSQFAKTMAKNIDIDLAKTPLVDILTGYTRYRILQSKIDKAIEYIEEEILNNKIEKVNWDFDDCYYSDMPAQRIKPLIDILKEQ